MPSGTITSAANTFGEINGQVAGSVPGTLTGSVGVPGPAGTNGTNGINGTNGTNGAQGIQGIQGIQGATGVVAATAPLAYDAGTQTVSINLSGYLTDAPNDNTPYVRLSGAWEQLLIT